MKAHFSLISAAVFAGGVLSIAAEAQTPPAGYWQFVESREILKLDRCGAALCATLVKLAPSAKQQLDAQNPDVRLKRRALCGLTLISGLRPAPNSQWIGGSGYNPEDGRTYTVSLKNVSPTSMTMRASIRGLGLFGSSYQLRAVSNPSPCRSP